MYARGHRQVRARADVCARAHPSACALRQRGSRFDTSASLKLPRVKKKIGKNFLHADVRLKRTEGQVCPFVRVLNRRPNLHVHLVRQPCVGCLQIPTRTGGPVQLQAVYLSSCPCIPLASYENIPSVLHFLLEVFACSLKC